MSTFKCLAMAAALVACVGASLAGPVTGQGTWEATLKARDISGNAVALSDASAAFFYDTTLNVTWLADMNQTGLTTWGNAVAWAGALTTGGFSDWRLPTIIDSGSPGCDLAYSGTDCGYNVQTQVGSAYSEWAHLYYVTLGNLSIFDSAGALQSGYGLTNSAYFRNSLANFYWSSTEYAANSTNAWYFDTDLGFQGNNDKSTVVYAAAVRSGDVLRDAGTVPEPQSLSLALMALTVLGVTLRQRHLAPRPR